MVTLDLRTLHTTLVLLGANFNIVAHLVFQQLGATWITFGSMAG